MNTTGWRAGWVAIAVVCMAGMAATAGEPDDEVRGQFAEVRGLLGEAERSARGVRGAGAYLAKVRQMVNQAESNYNALMASQAGTASGKMQTYNPFGYELKRAPDGTLIPTGTGPVDLTSQAEDWAKQMKQVMSRIDAMRTGDQATLSRDVESMLSSLGSGRSGVTASPDDAAATETLGGKVLSEVAALSDGKPGAGTTLTHSQLELGKKLPMPKGTDPNASVIAEPAQPGTISKFADPERSPGGPTNPDYTGPEAYRVNLRTLTDSELEAFKRQEEGLLKENADAARRDIEVGKANQQEHDRLEAEASDGRDEMVEVVKDVVEAFGSKPGMDEAVTTLITTGWDYSKGMIKYDLIKEEIARLNVQDEKRANDAVLRAIQNRIYRERLKAIQDEMARRKK